MKCMFSAVNMAPIKIKMTKCSAAPLQRWHTLQRNRKSVLNETAGHGWYMLYNLRGRESPHISALPLEQNIHALTHSHTALAISSQESLAETRPRSLVATEIRAMFCNKTSVAGFVVHYRGAPCIFRGLLHTFPCKYLHVNETWFCSGMLVDTKLSQHESAPCND